MKYFTCRNSKHTWKQIINFGTPAQQELCFDCQLEGKDKISHLKVGNTHYIELKEEGLR